MDAKTAHQLLQIIHNRGEQWWSNPQAINEARLSAEKLDVWIDEVLKELAELKTKKGN